MEEVTKTEAAVSADKSEGLKTAENAGTEVTAQVLTAGDGESVESLLRSIRAESEKSAFWQRIGALCMAGILLVFTIAVLILVPKVMGILGHVGETLAQLDMLTAEAGELTTKAETVMEEFSDMAKSVTATSEGLSGFVDKNSGTLTESVQRLASIDFEGLNQGIQDLQDAVGPMADLFSRMSGGFSLFG
ncbi:MAG: hypothetical protein IJT34_02650, partial [Butyrivibrio sp.]|nr:hypothetical protein [Butyrivibrio sp.]